MSSNIYPDDQKLQLEWDSSSILLIRAHMIHISTVDVIHDKIKNLNQSKYIPHDEDFFRSLKMIIVMMIVRLSMKMSVNVENYFRHP